MRQWGSTAAERAMPLPCDDALPDATDAYHRAVDVEADAAVVFRWLCQLKVAPYSYDWIDNLGRRSPQRLTPGLAQQVHFRTASRAPSVRCFVDPGSRRSTYTWPPRTTPTICSSRTVTIPAARWQRRLAAGGDLRLGVTWTLDQDHDAAAPSDLTLLAGWRRTF